MPHGDTEPAPAAQEADPFTITVLLSSTPELALPMSESHAARRGVDAVWPGDLFALRMAVSLARAWGARVGAVSVGPYVPEADYLGPAELEVDAVRWIPGDAAALPHDRARVLAEAAACSGVIFAGASGPGHGSGAVPVYVAGILHAACATEVMAVSSGPPGVLLVERLLDDGWSETAEIMTPCVLACVHPRSVRGR